MDNLFISVFCGLIFAVDIASAYFGWVLGRKITIKNVCLFDFVLSMFISAGLFMLSTVMTNELLISFGYSLTPLICGILFAPVLIATITSVVFSRFEKQITEKLFISTHEDI